MFKIFGILVLTAILAGCTTMSPQEVSAQDDQTCQGYGVRPGSDGYVLCRMQLTQNHHEDDEQRRANMEALSANLMNQR